jgi:hypothetical protein
MGLQLYLVYTCATSRHHCKIHPELGTSLLIIPLANLRASVFSTVYGK